MLALLVPDATTVPTSNDSAILCALQLGSSSHLTAQKNYMFLIERMPPQLQASARCQRATSLADSSETICLRTAAHCTPLLPQSAIAIKLNAGWLCALRPFRAVSKDMMVRLSFLFETYAYTQEERVATPGNVIQHIMIVRAGCVLTVPVVTAGSPPLSWKFSRVWVDGVPEVSRLRTLETAT